MIMLGSLPLAMPKKQAGAVLTVLNPLETRGGTLTGLMVRL